MLFSGARFHSLLAHYWKDWDARCCLYKCDGLNSCCDYIVLHLCPLIILKASLILSQERKHCLIYIYPQWEFYTSVPTKHVVMQTLCEATINRLCSLHDSVCGVRSCFHPPLATLFAPRTLEKRTGHWSSYPLLLFTSYLSGDRLYTHFICICKAFLSQGALINP